MIFRGTGILRILALAGLLIQAGCAPGLFVSPEAQALYDRVAWSVVIVEARDDAGGVACGTSGGELFNSRGEW